MKQTLIVAALTIALVVVWFLLGYQYARSTIPQNIHYYEMFPTHKTWERWC